MQSGRAIQLSKAQLYALVGGALVLGGLLGGGGCYLLLQHSLSEEPPIRVKKGSMDIELLGAAEWVPDTADPASWIPSPGGNRNMYHVKLFTYGSPCETPPPATAVWAKVTYGDGQHVRISAAGNQTKLKPKDPLVKLARTLLSHPGLGGRYVTKVELTGGSAPWQCSFAQDTFQQLCLCNTANCSGVPECR